MKRSFGKKKLLALIMAIALIAGLAIPAMAAEFVPAEGAVKSVGGVGFHCDTHGGPAHQNVKVYGNDAYNDGDQYGKSGGTGIDLWLVPIPQEGGGVKWVIQEGQGTFRCSVCGNDQWCSFSNEDQVFDGNTVQLGKDYGTPPPPPLPTPEFNIAKVVEDYDGDSSELRFDFEYKINDGEWIPVEGVIPGTPRNIKLDSGFTGTVTIREKDGEDADWNYDSNVYALNFTDGEFKGGTKTDGETTVPVLEDNDWKIFASFTNIYDPVPEDPGHSWASFVINKIVDGYKGPKSFKFEYWINGDTENSKTVNVRANKSTTVRLKDLEYGSTVTVREVIPENLRGWTYDPSVYVLEYTDNGFILDDSEVNMHHGKAVLTFTNIKPPSVDYSRLTIIKEYQGLDKDGLPEGFKIVVTKEGDEEFDWPDLTLANSDDYEYGYDAETDTYTHIYTWVLDGLDAGVYNAAEEGYTFPDGSTIKWVEEYSSTSGSESFPDTSNDGNILLQNYYEPVPTTPDLDTATVIIEKKWFLDGEELFDMEPPTFTNEYVIGGENTVPVGPVNFTEDDIEGWTLESIQVFVGDEELNDAVEFPYVNFTAEADTTYTVVFTNIQTTTQFSITKTTGGYSRDFSFTYAYEWAEGYGADNDNYANGEETVVIPSPGSKTINLPTGFTGVVTVSEVNDRAAYWTYDLSVYTLNFSEGLFISGTRQANGNAEPVPFYLAEDQTIVDVLFNNTYYYDGGGDWYPYTNITTTTTPTGPEPTINLGDPEVPLIQLPNQQTPLASEPDLEIPNPDTPLANALPATGLSSIYAVFFAIGSLLFLAGVYTKLHLEQRRSARH